MKKISVLPLRPGCEIVYQIFPDRWLNGRKTLVPKKGEWKWHGYPIQVSKDTQVLTTNPSDQYTFFGGNMEGIRLSLDYLCELGVTAIYLNPIFAARSTHRYDAIDYFRIDPVLGSRRDFENLASEMHQRGMRLVLDGVFNHTSHDHPWHKNLATRKQFYIPQEGSRTMSWMGSGFLPKLDTQKAAVTKRIFDILDHWPEADGWRLDAAHLLPYTLLRQIRKHAAPRTTIIEDWNYSKHYFDQGLADGVTNFLFRESMRTFFKEDCSPETLLERLRSWIDHYSPRAVDASWNFLDNHDTERFISMVGRKRLMQAFVFLFTLPGTPMLYHGIEIGLAGKTAGQSRTPMLWNPKEWDNELRDYVRALIRIRTQNPVLCTGKFKALFSDNRSRTLAFERKSRTASAIIAINDGYHPCIVKANGTRFGLDAGEWKIIVENSKGKHIFTREKISDPEIFTKKI